MPVLRNAKSISIWSIAEDVPKPAGIVLKPARLLHNEMTGHFFIVFFKPLNIKKAIIITASFMDSIGYLKINDTL